MPLRRHRFISRDFSQLQVTKLPTRSQPLAAANLLRIIVDFVILSVVVVAGFTVWVFFFSNLSTSDMIAAETAILTAVTAALAGLAALVAIAAYRAALQAPDLVVELAYPLSKYNRPNLIVPEWPKSGPSLSGATLSDGRQTVCTVYLHNRSTFSAKNPAVRIELVGLGGFTEDQQGWRVLGKRWTSLSPPGVKDKAYIVQWDGGADYSIHGNWSRELPPLNFSGIVADHSSGASIHVTRDGEAYLGRWAALVQIVAEGFPRTLQVIPIKVMTEAEENLYFFDMSRGHSAEAAIKAPDWAGSLKPIVDRSVVVNADRDVLWLAIKRIWKRETRGRGVAKSEGYSSVRYFERFGCQYEIAAKVDSLSAARSSLQVSSKATFSGAKGKIVQFCEFVLRSHHRHIRRLMREAVRSASEWDKNPEMIPTGDGA